MSKPDHGAVQSGQKIVFGGLDGEGGAYCILPQTIESLAGLMPEFPSRGIPKILRAGLDPLRLAEAGWGVVWAPGTSEAIRQAMAPLLEWRQRLAGPLFRELEYFTGESIFDFLERFDAGPDSVEPAKVPYYLLLVGSPNTLPFDLQSELAVSRAVGRISFESAEGYAEYAERLVEYERQQVPSQRTAAFFGVENRDDLLTSSSVENFIKPLEQMVAEQRRSWGLETYLRHAATKDRLQNLLCGNQKHSVLFTASHAVRYRLDSPRQGTHQGALTCADWPGPERWQGAMRDEHMLAAPDIPPGADLTGLIAFLFGCYSAGTPRFDSYGFERGKALAKAPFISPLPRTLLRRGALAIIGHVDLVLEKSFLWLDAEPQLQAYFSVLHEITAGVPVGHAFRHLSQRYAQLAVHAASAARRICRASARQDVEARPLNLHDFKLWAAYEDARGYILVGDPAACIHV